MTQRHDRRLACVLGLVAVGALSVPANARSATLCVSIAAPACEASHPNVQAALDAAEATSASDRVVIGAGTFDGPFLYAAFNGGGIDVVGQGTQTILTDSPTAPVDNVTVLDLRPDGSSPSDVSDLAVHMPANATGANPGNIGIDAGGTVERVEVSGSSTEPAANNAVGVMLGPGEAISDSEVRMPGSPPGGTFSVGVAVSGTGATPISVSDVVIAAPRGIEAGGANAAISRSRITSRQTGIDVCTSRVLVEDSVLRFTAGNGIGVNAGRCSGTEATLTARHLTLVGPGTGAGVGIDVITNNQAPTINRSATVTHSVLRSMATAFRTMTQDPAAPATATTSVSSSIFEAGRVTTTTGGGGAATFVQPEANFDVDPLFSDALLGDFTLSSGSPAIDANFSPPLAAGESETDLDGNPRITDGDGDGVAERDIGAFESDAAPPTPPVPPQDEEDKTAPNTTITDGPARKIKTRAKRKRLSFAFVSNEAGSRFECSVDDAAFAACASPLSRKFKRGRHTFAVRAIDAAGNVDASPAEARFRIKSRR